MKKKRKAKAAAGMAATTTAKDWGFGPLAGKGGKTRNSGIGDTMFHREMKEAAQEEKSR